MTRNDIEQELIRLGQLMPRLLQDSRGAEFWIEFLSRTDALRSRTPPGPEDWATDSICELLARHGVSPPWRWIMSGRTPIACTHAFPVDRQPA